MKRLLLAALFAGSVVYAAPSASACHSVRPWDPGCWTEESMCPILITLAPSVDGVSGGVLYIDPASGDMYVSGDLFWDCPPYTA